MPATRAPTATSETRTLPALVTKVGNLTHNPELRHGKNTGMPFVSVGIAVNTPKALGDWAGDQDTTFYEVTAFGSLAENLVDSVRKGERVIVIGRPEVEHYTGKDGTQRERKRIIAEALGPDLRWATAIVLTTPRASSASPLVAANDKNDKEPF
jgi:single-strand DNA-binding protein